jgi:hypothetical protein
MRIVDGKLKVVHVLIECHHFLHREHIAQCKQLSMYHTFVSGRVVDCGTLMRTLYIVIF